MRRLRLAVALCAALAVLPAPAAQAGEGGSPVFEERPWPFLLDQWGIGRTYRCLAADCGVDVIVYLRAKIGFCNCQTGVADDAELERVGDVNLLSDTFVALRPGQPIKIGWMDGRSRLYDVAPRYANKQNALAVAFNDKCDVIVATVMAQRTVPPAAERAAFAFLNSDAAIQFFKSALGL